MCEFCEIIKKKLTEHKNKYFVQSVDHIDVNLYKIQLSIFKNCETPSKEQKKINVRTFFKDLELLNYNLIYHYKINDTFVVNVKYGGEE